MNKRNQQQQQIRNNEPSDLPKGMELRMLQFVAKFALFTAVSIRTEVSWRFI